MSKRKLRFSEADLITAEIAEGEIIECEIGRKTDEVTGRFEKFRFLFKFDGIHFVNDEIGPLENLMDEGLRIIGWDYVNDSCKNA